MTLREKLAEAEQQVAQAREEWQLADAAYQDSGAAKSFDDAERALCWLLVVDRKLSFIRDTLGVTP